MAGGCSLLLFALFYLIIDVWGKGGKFFFFFKIIGLNSITVYMATRIIPFNRISSFFFQGIIGLFPENWSMLLNFTGNVTIIWLFLYFLYKQKIFLKV
jgi:predicted acyltransferase